MRLFIFFILALSFTISGISQNSSGMISYEEKRDMHRNLPPQAEMYKDRIPQFRTSKKELHFTATESLYIKAEITEEEKKERKGLDNQRSRRWRGPRGGQQENRTLYTNIADGSSIESQDFLGKQFLIVGSQRDFKWKITQEQKQVGSFLCQKATFQDTTISVDAWFTPMIPVSSGPADFGKLPGLILHVDINEGEHTYTALEIDLKEIEDGIIVKPTEGEQIDREEFEKIRAEKMEERQAMRANRGGRGYRRH